jgi:hypothetical protein
VPGHAQGGGVETAHQDQRRLGVCAPVAKGAESGRCGRGPDCRGVEEGPSCVGEGGQRLDQEICDEEVAAVVVVVGCCYRGSSALYLCANGLMIHADGRCYARISTSRRGGTDSSGRGIVAGT